MIGALNTERWCSISELFTVSISGPHLVENKPTLWPTAVDALSVSKYGDTRLLSMNRLSAIDNSFALSDVL